MQFASNHTYMCTEKYRVITHFSKRWLSSANWNLFFVSGFVKTSASCLSVNMYWTSIKPSWIYSQIEWIRTLMCLVLLWCTGLYERSIAPWKSSYIAVGVVNVIPRSRKSCLSQITSSQIPDSPIYSASIDEFATVGLSFEFQLMGVLLKNVRYPVVDLHESGSPPNLHHSML